MRGSARFSTSEHGQSLVEIALALPLMLALLLGLVDGARAFYVAGAIATASREAANFAARNPSSTQAQVTQRACDATAFVAFGSACPGLTVTCTADTEAVTVEVRYSFSLLTASVAEAAFKFNPIPISAASRYPMLAAGAPCAT